MKAPTESELKDKLESMSAQDRADALEEASDLIFKAKPVPLDEFIGGRRYLNLQGRVYPEIMRIANEVHHHEVREAYLSMGQGSGKSTLCGILMARWVYELIGCYRDPQGYFGLLPDSTLTILNVSTSAQQAKRVVFASFMARIRNSPWFEGQYEDFVAHSIFPGRVQVVCGHSGSTSFLGFDTIAAIMDETSWMLDTSQRSVAEDIYDMLIGSLKTRFPRSYKLVEISSPRTTEDFLTKQVDWVKKAGAVFVPGERDADGNGRTSHAGIV